MPWGSGVIVVKMLVLFMSPSVLLHYSNSEYECLGYARHVRLNNVLSRIGIENERIEDVDRMDGFEAVGGTRLTCFIHVA
jgi:hypothetical protein